MEDATIDATTASIDASESEVVLDPKTKKSKTRKIVMDVHSILDDFAINLWLQVYLFFLSPFFLILISVFQNNQEWTITNESVTTSVDDVKKDFLEAIEKLSGIKNSEEQSNRLCNLLLDSFLPKKKVKRIKADLFMV